METLSGQDNKLLIERATVEDIDDILKIKREAWLDAYPNEELGITIDDIQKILNKSEAIRSGIDVWTEVVNNEDGVARVTYIAKLGDKAVGFANPRVIDDKNFIGAIYVKPDEQNNGIGSMLMVKSLAWLGKDKDIYLHVASYNQKAINFYKKFGFVLTGKKVEESEDSKTGGQLPESEMILRAD